MKISVPFGLLLAACLLTRGQAYAGCSVVQTASNEIVVRTSVGGCDSAALRESLQGALGSGMAGMAAAGAVPSGSLAGVRRSGGQNALWRLAVINSQSAVTTLNMPGRLP
jgi:hypothetical protein